jgi:hypothetical protein
MTLSQTLDRLQCHRLPRKVVIIVANSVANMHGIADVKIFTGTAATERTHGKDHG